MTPFPFSGISLPMYKMEEGGLWSPKAFLVVAFPYSMTVTFGAGVPNFRAMDRYLSWSVRKPATQQEVNMNVMRLNHTKAISWSLEKLSSMKPFPGKEVRGHCFGVQERKCSQSRDPCPSLSPCQALLQPAFLHFSVAISFFPP